MNYTYLLFSLLLCSCYSIERDCTSFKTGKFESSILIDGKTFVSEFSRTKNIQIEYFNSKTDTASVRWINDCEMIFKTLNPKNRAEQKDVHLKILSTTKDAYTFEYGYVGSSIKQKGMIDNRFLAKANMFSYNVGLTSLVVGANGDYTVKSSEDLYTNNEMLSKLMEAYTERCAGQKTLIFNNGINTSLFVYDLFRRAGLPIAHLDNTTTKKERANILKWFKNTPGAILTSVSILTTGFDEPSVEAIILNRATKSLTLYYQMIGRGSRIYKAKDSFNVIDLGNNFHRFGPWGSTNLDWQRIFKYPSHYLDGILSDEDLENNFKYEMPEAIRESFSKSEEVYFDINKTYIESIRRGESSKVVLKRSIEQHAKICIENSEDIFDALTLIKLLDDDIEFRINRYSKCISKSTHNFLAWLIEDYKKKLRSFLRLNFDVIKSELSLKS